MVSTFVCFQLTFVNQFWYLMLTMFCSQSKMHLRLAAVVGINFKDNFKLNFIFKYFMGASESATQTQIMMLLIGF